MVFSPQFLDELKHRFTLSDVVGRQVKLVLRGREHQGLCPFHNEKTPSFFVTPSKNFFHCFGCQESGDALTFVKKINNLQFIDAVKSLAE